MCQYHIISLMINGWNALKSYRAKIHYPSLSIYSINSCELTMVTDAFFINKSNVCVKVCDLTTEHTHAIQTTQVKVTL